MQGVVVHHGLDKLEMGVAEIEMGQFDSTFVNDFGTDNRETELVSPELEGFFSVRYRDGNMIESLMVHLGLGLWINTASLVVALGQGIVYVIDRSLSMVRVDRLGREDWLGPPRLG